MPSTCIDFVLLLTAVIWLVANLWMLVDGYQARKQQQYISKDKPVSNGLLLIASLQDVVRQRIVWGPLCFMFGILILIRSPQLPCGAAAVPLIFVPAFLLLQGQIERKRANSHVDEDAKRKNS